MRLVLIAAGLAALIYSQTRSTRPSTAETTFFVHRLSDDHAEGITTLDMNGDGRPDLVSGAYWYENPGPQGGEWKRHQWRTVEIVGEFVSDCGEWAVDVNHDGAPDIVTVGWMTDGLWWYENPKKPDTLWQRHLIAHTIETEGGWMADLNGDGKPDLALAHYGHAGMLWVDFAGAEPRVHHAGGREEDGHGVGMADIDGDGKPDLLSVNGWFRNVDANRDQWEWHGDWKLGDAGFPIIGYDVNNDGKLDLIVGQGHGYGLFWMEQQGGAAGRQWVRHSIDESFSQSHALVLADIDGDGQPELITGKRYRGHDGGDPGSYDPLVVYYYKLDRKTAQFTRVPISMNGSAGVGTQILVADFDGDGDLDLATAGKTGVHFFENLKVNSVSRAQREKEILLNHTSWPFAGEGANAEWQRSKKK
jgi:FG-GAP-like repeat/FG-GAP repeat